MVWANDDLSEAQTHSDIEAAEERVATSTLLLVSFTSYQSTVNSMCRTGMLACVMSSLQPACPNYTAYTGAYRITVPSPANLSWKDIVYAGTLSQCGTRTASNI